MILATCSALKPVEPTSPYITFAIYLEGPAQRECRIVRVEITWIGRTDK